MSDFNFTVKDISDKIKEIAAENPNFVYEAPDGADGMCIYFHPNTGTPSCIVGCALAQFGVTLDDINDLNEGTNADEILQTLGILKGVDLDSKVDNVDWRYASWINNVQRRQDDGRTWKEAVDNA